MNEVEGIKRIKKLIDRAKAGEELVLGFFGGSITQGSLSSEPKLCYAHRVFDWFEKEFPNAKFHYVNAGIGGTSSYFGVSRVYKDLLMYRPDFVIVDFSVNDDTTDLFKETYEGLIRRIWYSDTEPAMLLLNNVYYDDGRTAEDIHIEIGKHYGIPNVSIKDTIYKRMIEGIYRRDDITPDGLHPNDLGHELLAKEITDRINEICGMDVSDCQEEQEKEPVTANRFEDSIRYTIETGSPVLSGFRADAREKEGHLDFFKNGWIATKAGDSIHFELSGVRTIAIQYRKTINRPAPVALAVLDECREKAVVLDSNFDEDWGDCLYLQQVLNESERKDHTLDIEIVSASEEDKNSFYLLSLIVS